MMYLNKEQFLNEVKSQELKFLAFFDKERENYDNINGNFRTISCTKRAEFPQVIEELNKFIEDYKNNTFICKAAPYRNGRNFKIYKVNFGGTEPAQVINNLQQEEAPTVSEELKEKLLKLAEYESRDKQRNDVLNIFVDSLFNKIASHIENIFINNLNLTPMNGEQENQTADVAAALETILEILGAETVLKVATKLQESPTKYKMLLKGFL